jgi:hypothetical protein
MSVAEKISTGYFLPRSLVRRVNLALLHIVKDSENPENNLEQFQAFYVEGTIDTFERIRIRKLGFHQKTFCYLPYDGTEYKFFKYPCKLVDQNGVVIMTCE